MTISTIIKTLFGMAEFVYLNEPDTEFKKEGVYKVDLKVSKLNAEPVIKVINEAISKKIADAFKETKKVGETKRAPLPFSKQTDGTYTFRIKSQFKPKLWDKDQKALGPDIQVWKDSTMWVQFKLNPYNTTLGVGCALYLQNVQIDNLVQGSSQNGACPFPKRAGSILPAPEKAVAQ